MKPTFKAYIAGFLDGEGCIAITKDKKGPYYKLVIGISQRDPNHLFDDIIMHFGGSKHYISKHQTTFLLKYVPYWKYDLISTPRVTKMLMKIAPYIRLKKDQVALGIVFGGIMKATRPFWYGRADSEGRRFKYPDYLKKWQHACYEAISQWKIPPASETERAKRFDRVKELREWGNETIKRMRQSNL